MDVETGETQARGVSPIPIQDEKEYNGWDGLDGATKGAKWAETPQDRELRLKDESGADITSETYARRPIIVFDLDASIVASAPFKMQDKTKREAKAILEKAYPGSFVCFSEWKGQWYGHFYYPKMIDLLLWMTAPGMPFVPTFWSGTPVQWNIVALHRSWMP